VAISFCIMTARFRVADTAHCSAVPDDSGHNSGGVIHAPGCGMDTRAADIERLTERVIGCAITVHREMGPGLLEAIYRECLVMELLNAAIPFQCERRIPIAYRGNPLKTHLQIDLLVDDRLVVELKAVDAIHPAHKAKVIAYLKLTGCPAGLLINFCEATLTAGVRRFDHPGIYAGKRPRRAGQQEEVTGEENRRTGAQEQ
jgi:GxxExxY protein